MRATLLASNGSARRRTFFEALTLLPLTLAAKDQAADAAHRAPEALAVLKGDATAQPKKRSFGPLVLLAGLVAGAAYVISKRKTPPSDPWAVPATDPYAAGEPAAAGASLKDKAAAVATAAKDKASEVKDTLAHKAGGAKDAATDAAEQAQEAVEDAADTVADKAEDALEETTDAMADGREAAGDALDEAAEKVDQLQEAGEDAGDEAGERLKDAQS